MEDQTLDYENICWKGLKFLNSIEKVSSLPSLSANLNMVSEEFALKLVFDQTQVRSKLFLTRSSCVRNHLIRE